MCGLAGFFDPSHYLSVDVKYPTAKEMIDRVYTRGPDDYGIWSDNSNQIILAHRRLSIIELTKKGHQPMHSICGRYVIAFNGEIYNHLALRIKLDKISSNLAQEYSQTGNTQKDIYKWKGHSDTETLLACISSWGLEKTLNEIVGMYAIVIWDKKKNRLQLIRDRFGEKPLYYGFVNGMFCFASELKSLHAIPGFRSEIDRRALVEYMRYKYVPAPLSIYQNIFKLPAGSILTVYADDVIDKKLKPVTPYWSAQEIAQNAINNQITEGNAEYVSALLEKQLEESVKLQMIADVPLGAFLSGGVDSSLVAAIMQKQSTHSIKTFTIGFVENDYNEAIYAKKVAEHLGTDHTELYLTPSEAINIIPELSSIYNEPFSDSSQIATFLLAKMTSHHVTVALSGDGGDELFGGYNRHIFAAEKWDRLEKIPLWCREYIANILNYCSRESCVGVINLLNNMFPLKAQLKQPDVKLRKIAEAIRSSNGKKLYKSAVSNWNDIEIVKDHSLNNLTTTNRWPDLDSLAEQIMLVDTLTYLTDDILVKVDRAAMAVSLETRIPLLDHRLFELAWRIPIKYKLRNGQGKWILRHLLYKHVPKYLIERPKMGFSVPIGSWLRGPLRDWAEDLLDKDRLIQEGYLNHEPIRRRWKEHLSGNSNYEESLWSVLMFQSWLHRFHNGR